MRTFALRFRWRKELFSAGLVLFLFLSAWILDARADDAPAGRAARLSFLQGDVTVDHLDNTAGDPAQINMPLAEGVRLTTGEDGQAEVEFEDGSIVRLTPNSSLGLSALSVDPAENFHTQVTILHGLIYAELRASSKYLYIVDAGGELISPVANATLRINLDQPPATVSVFDGTVQIEHPTTPEADGYKKDVRAGESLTGDASDSSQYSVSQNVEQDSWDEWNRARDQAAADAALNRTAARDGFAGDQGYGWSDLDANGSWYDVQGQGQLWQPTVAQDADFDPYGYGSWVAYPGAGYVWASGYTWGWTPFHCGHWSYWNSFGWGWSPGAGCGRAGLGYGSGRGPGGGVFTVNIARAPQNYRLPTRPIHEPGMLHPIPVGHAPPEPGTGLRPSHEPRMIAGVPAEPMRPVGNVNASKDRGATGAALRSDFAVDRVSRQPVLGVAGSVPAATIHGDSRSGAYRSVPPPVAATGSEQPARQMRPPPPVQTLGNPAQRSAYPGQIQGDHPASRPSQPVYTPRSSPPASPQPASRPMPPPAPHAVRTAPAAASPK
jgi:FecR protein